MKNEKYVKALEISVENIQKISEIQGQVANVLDKMVNNEKDTADNIKYLFQGVDALLELQKNTDERVSDIYQTLYEMFPDSEIIETMGADDQEARMKLYKSYLNLNDDWDK